MPRALARAREAQFNGSTAAKLGCAGWLSVPTLAGCVATASCSWHCSKPAISELRAAIRLAIAICSGLGKKLTTRSKRGGSFEPSCTARRKTNFCASLWRCSWAKRARTRITTDADAAEATSRMGRVTFACHQSASIAQPGFARSKSEFKSSRRSIAGVPVRSSSLSLLNAATHRAMLVAALRTTCASSITSRRTELSLRTNAPRVACETNSPCDITSHQAQS